MKTSISLALTAIILIFTLSTIVSYSQESYTIEGVFINVYEDGSTQVTYVIKVSNPPINITVESLGKPFYIECISGDTVVPVDIEDSKISFTAYNEYVNLTYITEDLTSKQGDEWTLSYILSSSSYIFLPEDALIYQVKPSNFDITIIGDKVALVMPPGDIEVKYVIYPAPQEQPGKPKPTPVGLGDWIYLVVVIIGIIIVVSGVFLIKRRSAEPVIKYQALDDRDRMILDKLRELGDATAKDLMDATGVPKTPLYRRLKRLLKDGYIDVYKKDGVKYYRIRRK